MHTVPTITVKKEVKPFTFRGEVFEIVYHYYIDDETGETFTTTELDELNIIQVQNHYRAKYGIPFVDEIKAIREQYGLTAAKMSDILGFGTNGYKNYENGEIPSIPHGRYIQLIKDPKEFIKLIELNRNEFEADEIEKVSKKVKQSLSGWNQSDKMEENYIFGNTTPNEFNGFKKPSLEKVGNMVALFSKALQPFTTKMNKLLFYADFLHYSKKGYSISGLNYIAITHGPVPKKYGTIYSSLYEKGVIDIELVDFGEGIEGERFIAKGKNADLEKFNDFEIEILNEVIATLGNKNTRTIVNISHDEYAWKHNVEEKGLISYQYSFSLIHV